MRSITLGEIASIITGPFGSQLHMKDYVDSGIPVIMPQNIGNRVVVENGIARISESDYQRLSRYATEINENTLLFQKKTEQYVGQDVCV